MRQIEGVIIHCSDTRPDWMAGKSADEKMAEIKRWHVEERGWRDVGYALGCDRDGTEAKGRDLDGDGDVFDDIGAHTKGHNRNTIGLVLFGGHGSAATDQFFDHFTPKQDAWLRAKLKELKARYPTIKWVKGHNEFANKACPGFNVSEWLTQAKPKTASFFDSGTNKAAIGTVATASGSALAAIGALDPIAQAIVAVGLVAVVGFAGYIIYSRVSKQRRGIL